MAKLAMQATQSRVGEWHSVQGLVDPPYFSGRYGTALSITVKSNSQIRKIREDEARHRLKTFNPMGTQKAIDDRAILEGLGTRPQRGRSTSQPTPHRPQPPQSKSQDILNAIRQGPGARPQPTWTPAQTPRSAPNRAFPWGWIIFGAVVLLIILWASH